MCIHLDSNSLTYIYEIDVTLTQLKRGVKPHVKPAELKVASCSSANKVKKEKEVSMTDKATRPTVC